MSNSKLCSISTPSANHDDRLLCRFTSDCSFREVGNLRRLRCRRPGRGPRVLSYGCVSSFACVLSFGCCRPLRPTWLLSPLQRVVCACLDFLWVSALRGSLSFSYLATSVMSILNLLMPTYISLYQEKCGIFLSKCINKMIKKQVFSFLPVFGP